MAMIKAETGGLKFLPLSALTGKSVVGHYLRLRNSTNPDYPSSKAVVVQLNSAQKLPVSIKGGGSEEQTLEEGTQVAIDFAGQLKYLFENNNVAPGMLVSIGYLGKDMTKKIRGKNPHQFDLSFDAEDTIEVAASAEPSTTATNIETFKKNKNIA